MGYIWMMQVGRVQVAAPEVECIRPTVEQMESAASDKVFQNNQMNGIGYWVRPYQSDDSRVLLSDTAARWDVLDSAIWIV
jgi:hypothetical protein